MYFSVSKIEKSTTTTMKSTSTSSYLLSSPTTTVPVSSTPSQVVISPCAACKTLRRKCGEKCVLAPYFPPTDPLKFTIAHRVFGASNIIKFLQELPESQRADAVSSMVYEANARLRDPVYGCTGFICQLQQQVDELQAQLAKAQAELFTMQYKQAKPVTVICSEMPQEISQTNFQTNPNFLDDNNLGSLGEPFWT